MEGTLVSQWLQIPIASKMLIAVLIHKTNRTHWIRAKDENFKRYSRTTSSWNVIHLILYLAVRIQQKDKVELKLFFLLQIDGQGCILPNRRRSFLLFIKSTETILLEADGSWRFLFDGAIFNRDPRNLSRTRSDGWMDGCSWKDFTLTKNQTLSSLDGYDVSQIVSLRSDAEYRIY